MKILIDMNLTPTWAVLPTGQRTPSGVSIWQTRSEAADMPSTTTRILQQELEFFERQRLDLLARAPGKYALVKGSNLLGIFETELGAVRAGYRQVGNEPFLIKHIVEADVPLVFTMFNLGV